MKKLLLALLLGFSFTAISAKSFLDEIDSIVGTSPEVNINLSSGLLNTILKLSGDGDAKKVSSVLSGLDKIRVAVYDLKGNKNTAKLSQLIKSKISDLSSQGFEQIVTVNDGDETINIVAKVQDELLQDALIVVMEENDELVFISMDGQLDLKQLAQISDHFDVDLDDIVNH